METKVKRQKSKDRPFPFPLFPFNLSKGFTIIEVVLVVAMMGILMLAAAPFLSNVQGTKDIGSYGNEATDALREAQSSVMSGKNNARFGVHFEATKFVFFQGAVYSAADPNNVVHSLTGFVGITAVALSPGGACVVATGSGNCDVHFANHRGTPAETGTVTLLSGTVTRIVTVNAQGMIDVN